MAVEFVVPTITPQDLLNFHTRIYGKAFASALPGAPSLILPTDKEHIKDDDDELGYYKDGTKRTLTDEQIAIFRHSEIQSLLRARRHAKECSWLHNSEVPGLKEIEKGSWPVHEDQSEGDEEAGDELIDGDDEEEYARFLEAEQKEWRAKAATNKGKARKDSKARSGKASTRRIVREMDAIASTTTSLDYGDGASDARFSRSLI